MSEFTDFLDELKKSRSAGGDRDWFERRMKTAHLRVWDSEIPMMDTRGVAPVKDDEKEFHPIDALASGVGAAEENFGGLVGLKNFEDEGRAMRERNTHQYEDASWRYFAQGLLQSLPETAAIMAGSTAVGALTPVPGGTIGGAIMGFANAYPKLRSALGVAQSLYGAKNAGGAVLRAVTPASTKSFVAGETAAALEAASEAQGVWRQYIENAKANGTYEEGKTEREADNAFYESLRNNFGVISAFNQPQYSMLFGKGGKNALGKLLRAGAAAGSEGAEEVAQVLANASALGESPQWRDIRDAAVLGTTMGAGFHAVGRGGRYAVDKITGRPTEEEIEQYQEELKTARARVGEILGGVTTDDKGKTTYTGDSVYGKFRNDTQDYLDKYEEAPRQSYRDAVNEGKLRALARSENVPDGVFDIIMRTADEFGVPRERLLAQAIAESNGNQDEISPVGAIGVMQLMPETAQALGVDPYDVEQNILGGALYLKQQYDEFGDWSLAHAAYNAGSNAVKRYGGIPPYAETQGYVSRINDEILGKIPDYEDSDGGTGERGGNVFGKENYDMPLWGNPDVASLKAGWSNILPQIGGALKSMGFDPVITSGGRTQEHQMSINPSAPNSYHIIRDEGGDAVDISLAEGGVSAEQAQRVLDYFESTGLFKEVMYHDKGSGLHLHLGGLNTEALNNGRGVLARADEIYANKKRGLDANKPSWSDYVKEATKSKETTQEPEPEKARQIDLNDDIFNDFANDRLSKAVEDKDVDTIQFFSGMFEDDGTFVNTTRNQAAIRKRYGDEFTKFAETYTSPVETTAQEQPAQSQTSQQPKAQAQSTPQKTQSPAPNKPGNKYLRNAPVIEAGNKFLEELNATGKKENTATAVQLLTAIQSGDTAEVENILKQNGRENLIQQVQQESQAQQQEDPVKQNTTPENKLAQGQTQETTQPAEQKQPKQKLTDRQKAEQTLQNPAKSSTKLKKRRNYGNAILTIADEEGIEIPEADRESLKNGKTTVLNKWRDHLISAGHVTPQDSTATKRGQPVKPAQPAQQEQTQTPQETQQQPSLIERAREIVKEATEAAGQNWENIKQQYKKRGEQLNPSEQQRQDRYSRDESQPEIGAVRGENNPESEPYHVQTQEEIQAEQKARNDERVRQRQINDSYGRDDATGEAQPAQVNRDSSENPDDAIDIRQIIKAVQSGKMQGTPKVAPKETTQSQNKVYGNSAEVVSDKKSPYQTKYRVVEADELNASHTMDGDNVFANESYPEKLQPRDRDRVEMTEQAVRIANSLSPIDLMESRNVNQGAPVVRSDGVVLNGNGRTMAIRRAYETGKGKGYKDAIVQNAEKLGLDADKVSEMRRPVLVREVAQDISDEDVRDIISSTAGGARLGASEQAKIDAKKITKEALDLFPEDEVVDLTQAKSQDFVRAVIGDITTNADERNALTDHDGNVAQDGINRVKRALFARAYGDDGLISRMSESTDDNIRGVSNALLTAAPEVAKVQKSMEAGALYDYDLNAISAAAKKLSALRNEGKPVATFLKEQSLFGEETATPEAKEILRFFDRKKFAPNKIAQFLREIAKGIRNQGNPKQGSLFGAREPKPLLEIIKQAADNVENGGQTGTFAETGRTNENKGAEQNETAESAKTETEESSRTEKDNTEDTKSGQAQEEAVTPEEAAKRYNEREGKASTEGGADTRIINLVEDDPKDLTPQQKLLQKFSDALGTKIVFFDNPDGRFHGAFSEGITFLNVNSKKPLGGVFWHESFHWLKANNPKLYAKLVDAAGITDAQRKAFLERTGRTDLTTDAAIDEEILADMMDDVAKRTGLLQSIAGKNRGLVERVVQWLKDTMNKFIETFRNPTGRLTTKQAQALASEFGRIARQLKDADGNAIFRVNNRTGDIEVIGGRKTPNIPREPIEDAIQSPNIKYSIDPNDNSNKSWGQRIKNFATAIFGNKPPTKPHQQVITDALSKLARHKIYYGYNGKEQGDVVVDSHQKAIFARHGYDFEKLLPVVGKQIAANLKLPDTDKMSNYIADWMATGALNNNSPEAQAFAKAMRANPAEAELLQSVRDSFQALANMTPYEKYKNSMASGGKKKSDSGGFMENFVDDLHPVKKFEELLIDKTEDPKIAALIRDKLAPYLNSRLFKGKGALSDMMIGERGHKYTAEDIQNVRDVLSAQHHNVDFSRFNPLAAIVEHAEGDREGLEIFAVAKLDKEMYEKLREVDDKGNPKYPPGSFTPSQSEADADAVIKAGEKKFGKAHEELLDYANTLAAIQYTSGIISATRFYSMVNGWKNYVPTARVFDEDEPYSVDLAAADSLKQKTGSKRRIISPMEKLAANTEVFLRQAERNKVKLTVAQIARFGGYGDVFVETPKGDNRDHTVHFKENGQMKYLVVPDKSIVRALESIQTPADSNIILQGLKAAGLVVRGLYTMWNSEFAVGNPFRDMPDAFIHNKYGSRNPFVVIPAMVRASIDGLAQSLGMKTKTKDFLEFLAYGGTQSGFSYELTEGASNRVQDISGNTSKGRKAWQGFLKLMEASENMTRFATYQTALDGLVAKHGGKATAQDKKLAALQARSASVDFARAGKSMRSVNKFLLFSNAAEQSLALWGEKINNAARNKEGARKELFTALWKTFLGGVVPAILFSAFNYSDDDRRERYGKLENWEKDNYWVLATDLDIPLVGEHQAIRIPKGMDVFLRATSALTEEVAAMWQENRPGDWSRITTLLRNGLPSVTTTIFTPLIETWVNYSLFKDAPIVPYGQQDEPAYKQYGKNTSRFAKWLGEQTNFSPRKIDHLIAGYGGSQATYLTGGADGLPVLRRFLFNPDKNPRIVNDYYRALDEQENLLATYKAKRKDGQKVDLPEKYDRALHARLKAAQEPMRKISKTEMRIVDSEKLSDDQKKEKLRELEKRRVALCERVFKRAR